MFIEVEEMDENKKIFLLGKLMNSAAEIFCTINECAEGEEREDLLKRQLAIFSQLMDMLGYESSLSLETAVEDLIAVADAARGRVSGSL